MPMNRGLLVAVLLAACGNVTAIPPDSSGAAGASSGGVSGAAGAAGGPSSGGAAGKTAAGEGGAGGKAAQPPPACSVSASASVAVSWCGKGCGACQGYAEPCTFPTVTLTDNNGSAATCDLDTDLTAPTFTLTEQSGSGWLFTGGTLATPCQTIPAFVCAPSCAACPTQ